MNYEPGHQWLELDRNFMILLSDYGKRDKVQTTLKEEAAP
jgi:hypothetical protein